MSTHATITRIVLVDASAGKEFVGTDIVDGASFERSELPSSVSIRCDVDDPRDTKEVIFSLNGVVVQTEQATPFAIAGDSGPKYNPWQLPQGKIDLMLQEISKTGRTNSRNLTFTVLSEGDTDPSPTPSKASETPRPSTPAHWEIITTNGDPVARHESCFVKGDDGKGYLIGGRGIKPVSIFDAKNKSWTQRPGPSVEIHHMQCVAYDNKIWIGSSWTRGFPNEENSEHMYVYDIVADSWSTRPGLPEERRRGGAAFVLNNGKMWLAMGNRGGHGGHATTLGWLDMFDPQADGGKGAWSTTSYPDAPDPRDHTAGGIVDGKFCVAGGRDGGSSEFSKKPILPVNCFDFAKGSWERGAPISTGRAGAAAGTTCDGELMIVGGEGFGEAFKDVSLYNGKTWREGPPLVQGRHGSGLLVSDECSCGSIYIASGSGAEGGGPELLSTERYLPRGSLSSDCA